MLKKEKKQVYLRWAITALVILLVSLVQNTGGLLPKIYGVSAMPLIPLTVCIAMLERETAGACFGMFAGMLWDAVTVRGDGFHAVVLLLTGCACGLLLHYLMRMNFVTALLLAACAALLHNVLYWLVFLAIPGYAGAWGALARFYLPASLYSLLFLPVFFFPLRALSRRLKNPLSTNEEPSVIL
ncbi:MAG TPA: rod shape-determining protein MreD [Candidatus Fimivicinus intestinavium]|nr:rod shape-determining protein MreD [Candidatus Fimivicinus intestinavium]